MHFPVNASGRFIAETGRRTVPAVCWASTVASSSKGPASTLYSFPTIPNPTPYQIFHLKPGADQKVIKERYYELVKVHHPDNNHGDPTYHDRFQKIQAAYNTLRKGHPNSFQPRRRYKGQWSEEEHRRWTGRYNQWGGFEYEYDENFAAKAKAAKGEGHGPGVRQTEKIFNQEDSVYWVFGAVALVVGVAQFMYFSPAAEANRSHLTALQAIADARRQREEHGQLRREELKRFVEEKRKAKHDEGLSDEGSNAD